MANVISFNLHVIRPATSGALLREDGSYLLREDGGKLLLD